MSSETIDRIAPTLRPSQPVVMHSGWHHLLFLHWAMPPEQIQPLLPPNLDLDLFNGKAYLGLIPFTMTEVRPAWVPRLPGRLNYENFHETNVRTYVHITGRDPGVWFFSLDAANALAVLAARAWFKLPYYCARMSLTISKGDGESEQATMDYTSRRLWPRPTPATCAVRYEPQGGIAPAAPGTLEHFLVERYILYSRAGGHLYCGRVHHRPYPLQTARLYSLHENLIATAGIIRPDADPLIHYAREVQVEIFPLERVEKI